MIRRSLQLVERARRKGYRPAAATGSDGCHHLSFIARIHGRDQVYKREKDVEIENRIEDKEENGLWGPERQRILWVSVISGNRGGCRGFEVRVAVANGDTFADPEGTCQSPPSRPFSLYFPSSLFSRLVPSHPSRSQERQKFKPGGGRRQRKRGRAEGIAMPPR